MALDDVLIIVDAALALYRLLGDKGRKNIEVPDSKRACLLEQKVWEGAKKVLDLSGEEFYLLTEGFPEHGNPEAKTHYYMDPVDGTVYYVRQKSASPFPVTTVVSAIEGSKYQDVIAAAIVDLHTGEIWSASKSKQTKSNLCGPSKTGGNEEHDPLYLSDFYFVQNAEMRTRLKHPTNPEWNNFQVLNSGSITSQGVKVACGETDCLIHLVGPKGFELTAMYLLVKQAGGYTLDYNTGNELGETEIEFNNRQPVIMAKDETLARDLYEKLNN